MVFEKLLTATDICNSVAFEGCVWVCVASVLTASLELEDEVEGDSGEEEGDERSDGDGEEELEEVLL